MALDMESFTIKSRIKSLLRSPSIKLRKSRSDRVKDSLSSKVKKLTCFSDSFTCRHHCGKTSTRVNNDIDILNTSSAHSHDAPVLTLSS
uniref:Uncharacterized protein n=1 Tax=Cyprinus carpio TaxID=7962 RepID=A0A8C1PR31_CYPCA